MKILYYINLIAYVIIAFLFILSPLISIELAIYGLFGLFFLGVLQFFSALIVTLYRNNNINIKSHLNRYWIASLLVLIAILLQAILELELEGLFVYIFLAVITIIATYFVYILYLINKDVK